MSEPNVDAVREVFPVRFDGMKSRYADKDLRPRPVPVDDVHISELADPKALSAPGAAMDLTDLIPDETATLISVIAEQQKSTQTDSEGTTLLDQQPSSSPTELTSPGSSEPPAVPTVSQPTVTTPTSSSQTKTKASSGTAQSSTTASPAPSVPSAVSSAP